MFLISTHSNRQLAMGSIARIILTGSSHNEDHSGSSVSDANSQEFSGDSGDYSGDHGEFILAK